MHLRLTLAAVVAFTVMLAADLSAGDAAIPSFAGKRVLILGDSITQDGTWVSFLAYRLAKAEGKLPDLISIGLASETASGLSEKDHPFPRPCVHERLVRALDQVKPQVVLACYGMNDGIYHPLDDDRMKAFQEGITKLIGACAERGARVIVLTPPPFDPQPIRAKLVPLSAPEFGYRAPFDGYAGVLEAFAKWELVLPPALAAVIDFNGPITAYVAERRKSEPAFVLSGDGIHPTRSGHLLMADQVLVALGQPTVRGRLDAELAAMQADPLYANVAKWRETRSKGWLDFVGYTRGKAVKSPAVDAAEQDATTLARQIQDKLIVGAAGAR